MPTIVPLAVGAAVASGTAVDATVASRATIEVAVTALAGALVAALPLVIPEPPQAARNTVANSNHAASLRSRWRIVGMSGR